MASCASRKTLLCLNGACCINTLIYHKAISWSKLLADLEKTLPYDVKVVQIHPAIDSKNHVRLEMTFGKRKARASL